MIGAAGSRHINSRRRSSSPNVSPQVMLSALSSRLAAQLEEENESETKATRAKEGEGSSEEEKDKEEEERKSRKGEKDEQRIKGDTATNDEKLSNDEEKVDRSSDRRPSTLTVPTSRRSFSSRSPTPSRLSITDLPPGISYRRGRRRAVEIADHKAVVLLHSKLKGMKLEDIA